MSTDKYKRQLLAAGDIVETLHYGVFAVNWWVFIKKTPEEQFCIPIRVNISIHNITVFIFALGNSICEELNFAGPGYQSSFSHKFHGKQSLIVQSILKTRCQIDIYQQAEKIQTYSGVSPSDVWSKLNILN